MLLGHPLDITPKLLNGVLSHDATPGLVNLQLAQPTTLFFFNRKNCMIDLGLFLLIREFHHSRPHTSQL